MPLIQTLAAGLLSLAASQAGAAEASAPARYVLCTDFSEPAVAVLRTALQRRVPLDGVELRTLPGADLPQRVAELAWESENQATPPAGHAFVGYSLPLLRRATVLPLAPLPEALPTAHAAFRDPAGVVAGLWFDPVGVAYMARGADLVPERWEDLCGARYHGLLLLEEPRGENATGALLSLLAGRAGGVISAAPDLEGLDANRAGAWLAGPVAVLAALAGGGQGLALSSERAARAYQSVAPELRFVVPQDASCALVYGMVVQAGAGMEHEIVAALSDPDVVARIAVLEHLVPAGDAAPEAGLPAWTEAYRAKFGGQAARIAHELDVAEAVTAYFRSHVEGEFERRHERFSEYYDTIAIALTAAFVAWMLWRSSRRSKAAAEDGEETPALPPQERGPGGPIPPETL